MISKSVLIVLLVGFILDAKAQEIADPEIIPVSTNTNESVNSHQAEISEPTPNPFVGTWCINQGQSKVILGTNGQLTFKQDGYGDSTYGWSNISPSLIQYNESQYMYLDSVTSKVYMIGNLNRFQKACPGSIGCNPDSIRKFTTFEACD